jgi:hypothetical protein
MTTTPRTDQTARARVLAGLRQLADYLDAHPDIPVPDYGWDLLAFARDKTDDTAARAETDHVAALLGVQVRDDIAAGGHYKAARSFGPVTYEFIHVTARRRALHNAYMTYADAVTPDDPTPEAA